MRIVLFCFLLIAVFLWPVMLKGAWLIVEYFDQTQLSYLAILALIVPLAGQYFCSKGDHRALCWASTEILFVTYFIYRFYAFADGTFGVLLLEVLRAFLASRVVLGALFVIIPILFRFLDSVKFRIDRIRSDMELRKKERAEEAQRRREADYLAALPPDPPLPSHSQWVQSEMEKARCEHEDRLVAIRTSGLGGRDTKLLEDRSTQQMLRKLKELMESQERSADGGFQ